MRIALLLICAGLATGPAHAVPSTPLTEPEAIRLALARAEPAALEQARLAAAEAEVLAAAQRPNPVLSYGHERMGSSPATREHSLVLSQGFDLAGRRALQRDAASRRVAMTGAENAVQRAEQVAAVRRAFAALLWQQQALAAAQDWMQHFERVAARVDRLAAAGEASGYDRRRLAHERDLHQARLAAMRAELARHRAHLAALTGGSAEVVVAGALLPPELPGLDAALARLDQHPALLARQHHTGAAELEVRAAQRGALAEVTVGLGPRWVDTGFGRDSGFSVSLAVPLPLFDRQQAARQRAAAELRAAHAAHGLARQRIEAELRGRLEQAAGLRQTAADYRARSAAAGPALLRIAEAAYQGGESSLIELLDAYRGALEVETTALELELRAREARIEFDLLNAEVTP